MLLPFPTSSLITLKLFFISGELNSLGVAFPDDHVPIPGLLMLTVGTCHPVCLQLCSTKRASYHLAMVFSKKKNSFLAKKTFRLEEIICAFLKYFFL